MTIFGERLKEVDKNGSSTAPGEHRSSGTTKRVPGVKHLGGSLHQSLGKGLSI